MEKIVVKCINELKGEVNISSAKNAVLPIIAATILCPQNITIENTPMLEDVRVICRLLGELNCDVNISQFDDKLEINTKNIVPIDADIELIRKMRASFLIMGPMLARFGYCKLSMPGGCNIGSRPIDLHLKGFKLLGADVTSDHGFVEVKAKKLTGNRIYLDFPSVGATENIMMASVFANGTTIIENAAEEPEIWDLANFLNSMGANIKGAGTDVIKIQGVTRLKGCDYSVIPDQIEAGTFMIATVATGGDVYIKNVIPKHLESISAKLTEMGATIEEGDDCIRVKVDKELKGVNIKTTPYPGFPTDIQQPMSSLLSVVPGRSLITESIWESRHKHIDELKKMGANIKVEGRVAIIDGVEKLTGAIVKATDLRAGAAMVIAGLIAEGTTEITSIEHIDRGYPHIENKFKALGADIKRVHVEE